MEMCNPAANIFSLSLVRDFLHYCKKLIDNEKLFSICKIFGMSPAFEYVA